MPAPVSIASTASASPVLAMWSQAGIALLGGLVTTSVGVLLGYRVGLIRAKREGRAAHLQQQISLFYSPMVGLEKRMESYGELDTQLILATYDHLDTLSWDERLAYHQQQIEDRAPRIPRATLDVFDAMVDTFTRQYWLAEPSTARFYEFFCRYVAVLHALDNSLPQEISDRYEVEEEQLDEFYADLHAQLGRLDRELSRLAGRRTSASGRSRERYSDVSA